MPLTGQAKAEYMKKYMQDYRRQQKENRNTENVRPSLDPVRPNVRPNVRPVTSSALDLQANMDAICAGSKRGSYDLTATDGKARTDYGIPQLDADGNVIPEY